MEEIGRRKGGSAKSLRAGSLNNRVGSFQNQSENEARHEMRVVQSPGDLRTIMLAAWPPVCAYSLKLSATTLYDL